jgi:protein-tyrosine phosphatase
MLALAKETGRSLRMDRNPIRDTWIPSRVEMCRILDTMDETIQGGGAVFIHCIGGRGRTGTVVGCYLARHGMADGRQIITKIEMLRSHLADGRLPSPETPQQIAFVLSWVEGE